MKKWLKNQRGESLVEFLLSILVALFGITVVMQVIVNINAAHKREENFLIASSEMMEIIKLIRKEINNRKRVGSTGLQTDAPIYQFSAFQNRFVAGSETSIEKKFTVQCGASGTALSGLNLNTLPAGMRICNDIGQSCAANTRYTLRYESINQDTVTTELVRVYPLSNPSGADRNGALAIISCGTRDIVNNVLRVDMAAAYNSHGDKVEWQKKTFNLRLDDLDADIEFTTE